MDGPPVPSRRHVLICNNYVIEFSPFKSTNSDNKLIFHVSKHECYYYSYNLNYVR